jgi:methylphosphotriester-DNA--protein-cysteine methyltransferase
MIAHSNLRDADLRINIKKQIIRLGGNRKLKIYGTLHCRSGRRMKRENRVFFSSENEALRLGYRPCGKCMRTQYQQWKNGII